MQSVLSTLFQVIVPLSIPVAAGFLLVRFRQLDTRHLLTVVLYFLMPVMIFKTLTTSQITFADINDSLLFSLLNLGILWGIAALAARILKMRESEAAGLSLIATLTNSVNYGLPLVLLAFGELGLEKASVYVIIQMVMVQTVGVYMAARSQFSVKNAMLSVLKLPAIYALFLAVVIRLLDLQIPVGIGQGVAMVAQAYSPVVLTILGAQMASVKTASPEGGSNRFFWAGMTIRMIAAPLVAWACLTILGIKDILFPVLFILASMPVAVNAVILAEKFDASSKIVSKCILWTTLLSFITLPVLIVLVKLRGL